MMTKLLEGWKEIALGNICEIVSGTTPSTTKPEFWNGDIFWLTPADIENGHNWYCHDTKKKITNQGLQSSSLRLLPKGTVMLTSRAPIGKVAIAGVEMCTNQGFKNFICNKEIILPEYLYFWLRSKEEYLNSLGRGATFKEISKLIVSKIKIPLPSLSTQKQIVSILEKAEKLKEIREEADELTKKYVKSVFLEMFGDPVKNPKKWVVKRLETICNKITDGTHISPSNVEIGDFMYVTAKNIKEDGIDLTNITFIDKKIHDGIYRRCDVKKGDLLYIKDGVTTGIATINNLDEEFSLLSSVALIRPSRELDNRYLKYLLNFPTFYEKIRTSMGGAAITRLTLVKIKNIEIPLPPHDLQIKFSLILRNLEKMKIYQKQSREHIENLLNNLMQKAFKGELAC